MDAVAGRRLERNYNRAAWFYEASAQVFSAGQIRASKKHAVNQINTGDNAVFLGVGTGDEVALAARRGAHVTCVDISAGMLERLRERLNRDGTPAEILCQNAFQHDRPEHYDVCATNYFLNIFPEHDMVRMLAHAATLVRPGGKLVIADVALPQGSWPGRWFNTLYLKSAMATFWMLGLVPWHRNYDYPAYFPAAGLALDHVRYFRLFKSGPVLFQTIVATRLPSTTA